jgi:3-phosphoshikimate 1-carboxyvinyltransferase
MQGVLDLPGDKSLSHRVAMLAAVASGLSRIKNFNTGADCASTLQCLRDLGILIEENLTIRPATLHNPIRPLDCGNSGSTLRMLLGLLAGQNVHAVLSGDDSLSRRPMRRVADPLRQMGAVMHLRQDEYPPVHLEEGVKHGIEYRMPLSSAQVKTAILFAGLRFPQTRVIETRPSRDHTERMLAYLKFDGREIRGFEYDIPADPSAAAFFVVGALLRKESDLLIRRVLLNPFRIAYIRVLQKAGARIEIIHEEMVQNEPVGDIRVRTSKILAPIRITAEEVPSVIDEIPALSILGTKWGFEVSGASELRTKESDRIRAMVSNFEALKIPVREHADGYEVQPGKFKSGTAKSFGDHRIAMAFACAGIEIDQPECVRISLPEFFPLLKKLTS